MLGKKFAISIALAGLCNYLKAVVARQKAGLGNIFKSLGSKKHIWQLEQTLQEARQGTFNFGSGSSASVGQLSF